MALSKASLKSRILTELNGQGFDIVANGRDGGDWVQRLAVAIANAVVDEIQQNAKCKGNDSHGDSHDDVGIV